jgi:hypothetical protein
MNLKENIGHATPKMKLALIILCIIPLPSCQAIQNYRTAKAINDNIAQTEAWLARYRNPQPPSP